MKGCTSAVLHKCRCPAFQTATKHKKGTKQLCGRSRVAVQVKAKQGGLGDEDMDVAVFRFTLGIPGFDDRLIPRVVGLGGGLLLAINHVLGANPTPPAQTRAEFLCALLVAACTLLPDIEERLKEANPGRGRQKTADNIAGAANGFFLQSVLPDNVKKELAWASFSLLRNTNSCGVVLQRESQTLMARGALGQTTVTPGNTEASLAALSKDLSNASSSSLELASVLSGSTQQLWLPEPSSFSGPRVSSWASVPSGAQSLLVQHVPTADGKPAALLLYSERPRALSDRERSWAAGIAAKLGAVL